MRTSLPLNNFVSGQIDRDLKGRFDIPLTLNGHEISRNFLHTLKGNVMYRSGFKFVDEINKSALYPFEFNAEQSYLLVFDTEKIQFYSYDTDGNFSKVIKDDVDVSVAHPYGDEIYNLHITQNCDVLYITHVYKKFPEYQLKRRDANVFELVKTNYTNGGTATLSNESTTKNDGFPAVSCFYENRLNRMSSNKYPSNIYGSKGGDYNNITTGTEDNDGFKFDLAEANSSALWAISGANTLLIGIAEGIITVNGGSADKAITPSNITARLSCRDGCSKVRPIRKDNYVFFVSKNFRKLSMFEYDTLMEQFKATNLSKANYEITKGGISKLAVKRDRFDLMYAVCDGKLLTICFSNEESINSWAEWRTQGNIIDICNITRPDGDDDLLLCVERTINNETKYYLEKLSDIVEFSRFEEYVNDKEKDDKHAFYRVIAEEMRKCNYLDCSIEYSGLQKNKIEYNNDNSTLTTENNVFSQTDVNRRIWFKTVTGKEYGIFDIIEVIDEKTVKVEAYQCSVNSSEEWYLSATVFSGLEHLENETVAVVGNGGYIGDFVVKDGKVDISSANTNKVGTAIIGLKYKGLLKSCNFGLNLASNGTQTYTNMKNIYKFDFVLNFSAGGKVGDSLYHLNDIQDFNPEGLYDIPALPMDMNTVSVLCDGVYDYNKHYYIVQDTPLPFNIDMIVPHAKYVSRI